MIAETEVAQIDVYSDKRAGLIEQLGIMAGGTTWRTPMGGHGSSADRMPRANKLGMALSYARECNPSDTGPDILEALATGAQLHRNRIVGELTAALWIHSRRRARKYPDILPQIAADAFLTCCGVLPKGRPESVEPRDYAALTAVGEAMLWNAAERALRRLKRKLR